LACPRCGQPGKDVSLLTLKHQVKLPHLGTVEAGPFGWIGMVAPFGAGSVFAGGMAVFAAEFTATAVFSFAFGLALEQPLASIKNADTTTHPPIAKRLPRTKGFLILN